MIVIICWYIIFNTKLRQQEWSNNEIDRTDMINVPTLTRKN